MKNMFHLDHITILNNYIFRGLPVTTRKAPENIALKPRRFKGFRGVRGWVAVFKSIDVSINLIYVYMPLTWQADAAADGAADAAQGTQQDCSN